MLIKFASFSSPKTARVSLGKRSLGERIQAQLSQHHPRDAKGSLLPRPTASLECAISQAGCGPPNNVHHLLHSICQACLRGARMCGEAGLGVGKGQTPRLLSQLPTGRAGSRLRRHCTASQASRVSGVQTPSRCPDVRLMCTRSGCHVSPGDCSPDTVNQNVQITKGRGKVNKINPGLCETEQPGFRSVSSH